MKETDVEDISPSRDNFACVIIKNTGSAIEAGTWALGCGIYNGFTYITKHIPAICPRSKKQNTKCYSKRQKNI